MSADKHNNHLKLSFFENFCRFDGFMYFAFFVFFWLFRFSYWASIHEVPFSDIYDYILLGKNVAEKFAFQTSDFWKSYKTPGVPLVWGMVFKVFGSDQLAIARIFQNLVLFFSSLFLIKLIHEIFKSKFITWGLILSIAISKSSIFWSYKLSTECLSEAFTYLSIALFLEFYLRPNYWKSALLGFVFMFSVLIRPQSVLSLPLLFILFIIFKRYNKNINYKNGLVAFVAIVLVWLPWGLRNFNIYGHIVPLSTQGPYTFLWELGNVTIQDPFQNGQETTKKCNELQDEAERKFRNDYEAMSYANLFVKAWIKNNIQNYPFIVLSRIWNTINDKSEYLTRVSRTELFNNFMDNVLLDKNKYLITIGFASLILGIFIIHPLFIVVFSVPFIQWFTGALFLGYPRIFDPSLPIFLFGFFIFLYLVWKLIFRFIKRGVDGKFRIKKAN